MKRAWAFLLAAVTVAYPLLVYVALGRFEPRWLSLLLLGVALLRASTARQPWWWVVAACAALLALLSTAFNAALPLKLYPVLVNATLLAVFAASLRWPPSAIERFARIRHPDLPPRGVAYTRKVTQVWCGFFAVNGAIALATALYASERVWALYNGLLAYVLIGLLFAGEWWVRQRVMRDAPAEGASHG